VGLLDRSSEIHAKTEDATCYNQARSFTLELFFLSYLITEYIYTLFITVRFLWFIISFIYVRTCSISIQNRAQPQEHLNR
jgi:hypothetical protein